MKKESFVLFVLPIVVLFLGLFSGFYFGIYRTSLAVTACKVSKALIPASPVIDSSLYNPKTNKLELTVVNPGGMPIELLSKTLVLQPKVKTKAPVALIAQIPLGIVLPPYSQVNLQLDLGSQGSGFSVGDVLVTTLTYKVPVSNDVYSVTHLFEKSSQTNAEGKVKNALEENSNVRQKYEAKVKANSKK